MWNRGENLRRVVLNRDMESLKTVILFMRYDEKAKGNRITAGQCCKRPKKIN